MELEEFKDSDLEIVEIFKSISGEGISAGELASFVRVAGCNLRCSYCDTSYAYRGGNSQSEIMKAEQVVSKLQALNSKQVICTGGEPLESNQAKRYLPLYLAAQGFVVRIESNGSYPVYSEQEIALYLQEQDFKLNYTLDVKLPSSGMSEYDILVENLEALKEGDELKFVAANEQDLVYSLQILKKYQLALAAQGIAINFSPVFGELEAQELVEFLKKVETTLDNLKLRLSLQLHKLIWPAHSRGV